MYQRACYLHVGTHKTGTTSLQTFATSNEELLKSCGLFVPRTGRSVSVFGTDRCGHHNLAWELLRDERFNESDGTLAALTNELSQSTAPAALLSSEDFEYLFAMPTALQALRDALQSAGHAPHVILYVRPQANYAASLYGEMFRGGHASGFVKFAEHILKARVNTFYEPMHLCFSYGYLAASFSAVFGKCNVTVRTYHEGSKPDALLRDFASIVAPNVSAERWKDFVLPPKLNQSIVDANSLIEGWRARFVKRFRDENRRLNTTFGTTLPAADELSAAS